MSPTWSRDSPAGRPAVPPPRWKRRPWPSAEPAFAARRLSAASPTRIRKSDLRVLVGTSGWQYKEWKGSFYPTDIKTDAMLEYYAARFPTVEVNNTFYRMPKDSVLESWAARAPNGFTF